MAFATKNNIHIIDKNGNEVSPFPIESRDDITQSLSVFDYDKNGKYRFVDSPKGLSVSGKATRGTPF